MLDLRAHTARLGLLAAIAVAAAGLGCPAALAAAPASTLKAVTYLGYEFSVPASWPVIRTSGTSATCVRFDRHAIYLGDPGQNQACPSGLLGTTEAVVVQPAPGPVPAAAAEDRASRRITVVSPGIEVTATYDSDPALVRQILASGPNGSPRRAARLPAVPCSAGTSPATWRVSPAAMARSRSTAPAPTAVSTPTGSRPAPAPSADGLFSSRGSRGRPSVDCPGGRPKPAMT